MVAPLYLGQTWQITSGSFENNWSAQADSFRYGGHFKGSSRLLAVCELMIWAKCSAIWQRCRICGTEFDEMTVPVLKKKELGVAAFGRAIARM